MSTPLSIICPICAEPIEVYSERHLPERYENCNSCNSYFFATKEIERQMLMLYRRGDFTSNIAEWPNSAKEAFDTNRHKLYVLLFDWCLSKGTNIFEYDFRKEYVKGIPKGDVHSVELKPLGKILDVKETSKKKIFTVQVYTPQVVKFNRIKLKFIYTRG